MKKTLLLTLAALFSMALLPADTTVAQKARTYIDKYSDLAVKEMYRSGVPASITLAQGLLESGYGKSALAVGANNHFGIKCHSDWKGKKVYFDDDAKGECFRKYPSVEDSYRDHGDFLRYKPRYASLFDLETTDYKGWCYGLKKAGYATDPKYAQKLIGIIESYDLTRFDSLKPLSSDAVEELSIPQSPNELESVNRYSGSGRKGTYAVSLQREVLEINGIPFVYAREGETYKSIAALYDLFPKELARFNDSEPDRKLQPREVVFLRKKARYAVKGLDKHICSEGETLWGISQKYAISLKSLLKLNGIGAANAYVVREDNTLLLRPAKRK